MIDQFTSKIDVIGLFQAYVFGGQLCGIEHTHFEAHLFIQLS